MQFMHLTVISYFKSICSAIVWQMPDMIVGSSIGVLNCETISTGLETFQIYPYFDSDYSIAIKLNVSAGTVLRVLENSTVSP